MKAKRLFRGLFVAIATLLFALAAAIGGVVLHANLPAARRIARAGAEAALAGAIEGHVVIERLDRVGAFFVGGLDLDVRDRAGAIVLRAEGISLRVDVPAFVTSVLRRRATMIRLTRLEIARASLVLAEDPRGGLTLSRALAPPNAVGPGGTVASLPSFDVGVVEVRGGVPAWPVIDLDLAGVTGSLERAPDRLQIGALSAALIDRTGSPLGPTGILLGRFEQTAGGILARVVFDGRLGAIATSARVTIERDVVDALAFVRAAPGALAALDSRFAEDAPLDARLSIQGRAPSFVVEAHAVSSSGVADAVAALTIDPRAKRVDRAEGRLDAHGLDLSRLLRDGPRSDVAFTSKVHFDRARNGEPRGTVTLDAERVSIAGNALPAVRLEATVEAGAIAGVAHLSEPGATGRLRFDARAPPGSNAIRFVHATLDAEIPSLVRFGRLRGIALGAASARVEASIDLMKREVEASGVAELSSFASGPVHASRAHLAARAHGSLDHPLIAVSADVAGARAGGLELGRVVLDADGALDALPLHFVSFGEGAPSIDGFATLRPSEGGARLDDVRVRARRGDVDAMLRVATLRLAPDLVVAERAVVEGFGAPASGSIRITPHAIALHLHADGLDARRLASLFGREAIEGSLHVALDLEATRLSGQGALALEIVGASVDRVHDVNAHVVAILEGKELRGEVVASAAKIGVFEIKTDGVRLAGGPFSRRSWIDATGEASIDARADLAGAFDATPPTARPVSELRGALSAHAVVGRRDARHAPDLRFIATTDDLEVSAKSRSDLPGSAPPWSSRDLDIRVDLALDGEADQAELSAELFDPRGALAVLSARVRSPLERLRGRSDLLAVAAQTPIDVRLRAPRRSLEDLPLLLAGAPLRGDLALAVDVTGTALDPRVDATIAARGLFASETAIADFASAPPIDAVVRATYEKGRAAIHGALATDGRTAFLAEIAAYAPVEELLAGSQGMKPRWSASGRARFDALEVGLFGPFARRHIRGRVNGVVDVRDLHVAASLLARLDVSDLTLAQARFPRASIHVKVEGGSVHGGVRLDQTRGFGEARLSGGVAWGAALAPTYDRSRPLDVHLETDHLRAAAIAPLLSGTLSELDGRLDGAMWIHVDPDPALSHADGAIQFRDGVIEWPVIGQRIRDVSAEIMVRPWGTVRLERVSAAGWTGRLTGAAIARFEGTKLAYAEGNVHVAEPDALPLSLEGVPLGDAWGDVEATAQRSSDGRTMDVDVQIPTLHLHLPRATGNTVQPLDADPAVRVGVFTAAGFVELPLERPLESRSTALLTRAQINLGDDVVLTREKRLEVSLTGHPTLEVDGRLRVTGALNLTGGSIEVQSKRFTIDGGTVNFNNRPPDDPILFATAHWDAPDGTRVFADYRGSVQRGDLGLRSEPPLPRDDIVALIVFGSAGGSLGASPPPDRAGAGAAEAAGSLAAAPITQGINKAISGITGANISTRVDTSRAGNPRPELTVQLSKRLSATLSYNLGIPPPGDNPDRTQVVLDVRVKQRWAIDTMIGDRGSTSLDVIWRFRY